MREDLRNSGFDGRTNSYIPAYRFYRRPRFPERTVFSIPVRKIREEMSRILKELKRVDRLSPFSQKISEIEDPQT